MKNFKIKIDGIEVDVNSKTTILEAADSIGINIPRLCYHPKLSNEGVCRVCIVEIKGVKNYLPACATYVWEGMDIQTHSPDIHKTRRDIVELLLDNHPQACLTCERSGNCELQKLSYYLGIKERLFQGKRKRFKVEDSSCSVIRDAEKCVLCKRCIRVCAEVQGVYNLEQHHRGVQTVVTPGFEGKMDDSVCIKCGQCINVCPTASLVESKNTDEVFAAINDPEKVVIVQVAPAIRAAIGEGFGLPAGTNVTGKLVNALKKVGFDKVFDTDFGADLTIIEEAHEFLDRMNKGENLPMITSCSPGWVKYLEHFYPDLISHTSTCKSPMQMVSSLVKTYYAEKHNIDPENIVNVAIMPCTAKKFEADRDEHKMENGEPYTDYVLTTRELTWMIKTFGINFNNLKDEEFDKPLGISTGAGVIFGVTGGVMEAALRTAVHKLSEGDKKEEAIEFSQVRNSMGIKEVSVEVKGKKLNLVVANGLQNAKIVLDKIRAGKADWHLIEIMACPGGCIAGGGQPMADVGKELHPLDPKIIKKRTEAIYSIDDKMEVRKSHENPAILELYKDYLGEPGGKKAHSLLHTTYKKRLPKGIN